MKVRFIPKSLHDEASIKVAVKHPIKPVYITFNQEKGKFEKFVYKILFADFDMPSDGWHAMAWNLKDFR